MSSHQRVFAEGVLIGVLIGVGVVTCFLYWWYSGKLGGPLGVVAGAAIVGGFCGASMYFDRRMRLLPSGVAWGAPMCLWAGAVVVLAAGIVGAVHYKALIIWAVPIAYAIPVLTIEAVLRRESRRRAAA